MGSDSEATVNAEAVMEVVEMTTRALFRTLSEVSAEFVDALGNSPELNLTKAVEHLKGSCDQVLSTNLVLSGMGFVGAPEAGIDKADPVLWWIRQGQEIRAKKHVLNPASDSYYDYNTSEWFGTVRSTTQPFISSPYVDSWGTDQLTVTAAVPVILSSGFAGVVAADLDPARHLMPAEKVLLDGDNLVLIDAEGRVILSTIPILTAGLSLDRYLKKTGMTATAAATGSLTRWQAVYLS